MNCQMNCPARSSAHFIGHKRMDSTILVVQDGSFAYIKRTDLPPHLLGVCFQLMQFRWGECFNYYIHFSFTLYHWTKQIRLFCESSLPQFDNSSPIMSAPFLFTFKYHVQTFIFTEVSRKNIFKYGFDMSGLRGKPLSQFLSILLLHINSEQDYLSACQSRCSGKKEKIKE